VVIPRHSDRRKGPIVTELSRAVESVAPGVGGPTTVNQPLQTGLKAIDSMTPVGRGQRELIIGDRKTGKTAIAVDAIINQREENVICVYVAIGQRNRPSPASWKTCGRTGPWITPSSSSPRRGRGSPPIHRPYAGTAMAEYFMYEQGKGHALRLRRLDQAGAAVSPALLAHASPAWS